MKKTKIDPVIILPGINHSPTMLYDKNGEPVLDKNGRHIGSTMFFFKTDRLKEYISKLLLLLEKSKITRRCDGVQEAAYDLMREAFSYQKCDNNGNFTENLKTLHFSSLADMDEERLQWAYRMVPMQSLVEETGKEAIYFFTFNLVGDPLESAKELDGYIDCVLNETGAQKVTLMPVSLGGTILTAYLDLFGFAKVGSVIGAVACLDGTDCAADLLERSFNISDLYLRHKFLSDAFKEITGDPAGGYFANIYLNTLPRCAYNALYTGLMSGSIDTVMVNCPQIWAMLPSSRYEKLSSRYLSGEEKAVLKEKADRFQRARLNLKKNLVEAKENGVKINLISGSNLSYGEKEYSFFYAIGSAGRVNTDGIIPLASTTLGATGALPGETLGEGYLRSRNEDYLSKYGKENPFISPDKKIDASTALFPENTWIFMSQHHEIGNNHAALNLIKDIILERVTDVNSDPVNHPQFNFSCHTKVLRRWRLEDAKRAVKNESIGLCEGDKASLLQLIERSERQLSSAVANGEESEFLRKQIEYILSKYGLFTRPAAKSKFMKAVEVKAKKISLRTAVR